MSKEGEIIALDLKPIFAAAQKEMLPTSPKRRLWLPSGRIMDDWNTGITGMKHLVQFCRKHPDKLNSDLDPFKAEQVQERERIDLDYIAETLYQTGEYQYLCNDFGYVPVHQYAQPDAEAIV